MRIMRDLNTIVTDLFVSRIIFRNILILTGFILLLVAISYRQVLADLVYAQPCSDMVYNASAHCTAYGICDTGDVREGNIQITSSSSGSCTNIYYKNIVQITGTVGGPGLHSTAQTVAGPAEVQVGAFFTVDWNCNGSNNSGQVNMSSCSEVSCSPTGDPPGNNCNWNAHDCQWNCIFDSQETCEGAEFYWNF